MIPLKLSLSNFMSYKDSQTLDFTQFNIACISGENGAGKSSILEAITWVLWGKTRSISDDNLIYQDQNNMWVEFEFMVGDEVYKVARKRAKHGRGSSELSLFKKVSTTLKNLSGDSIKETQNKIIDLLKIPYEIFINSAYLKQGQADEFTKKTPSERKEILGEILGLDYYDNLVQLAKEKIKDKLAKNEYLELRLNELASDVERKEEVEKEFRQSSTELNKNLEETSKLQREFRSKQKIKTKFEQINFRYDSLKTNYRQICDQIKELMGENEILKSESLNFKNILKQSAQIKKGYQKFLKLQEENNNLNDLLKKFSDMKEQKNQIERKIETIKHENEFTLQGFKNRKEHEMESLKNKIEELKSFKKCPTCLQKVGSDYVKLITKELLKKINELKKEKFTGRLLSLKRFNVTLEKIQKNLKKISYSSEVHEKISHLLEEYRVFVDRKDILLDAKINLTERNRTIKKNLIKIKKFQKQLIIFAEEGQKYRAEIDRMLPQIEEIKNIEQEIESFRNETLNLKEEFGQLKSRLSDIKRSEKELKQSRTELSQIKRETSILEDLSLIFGKKGIQAMVIASALPEIQDSANELLYKMTSGKMKVIFETQKLKKTDKKIAETLDIKILDNFGARQYEMFSGGEKYRINFAIRIALSKILAKRAGTKLKFLCIDEGFGTQDNIGRATIVDAIKSIEKDFEKIVIITHIQELKDLFTDKIEIKKDQNGSHILNNC